MKILYLLIAGILFSCSDTSTASKKQLNDSSYSNLVSNRTDTITTKEKATKEKGMVKINNLRALSNDSCSIGFYGGGLFHLCFKRNAVNFFFNPQCMYSYSTQERNDTLYFKWSYVSDCNQDMGLKKTFDVKKVPIENRPFGYFTLLNDTSLKVTYYYKEWVKKINESSNDVMFPEIISVKNK